MNLLAPLEARPPTILFILHSSLTHSLDHPMHCHRGHNASRQFFHYLVEDDEISENPMAKMKPPKVPERHRSRSN